MHFSSFSLLKSYASFKSVASLYHLYFFQIETKFDTELRRINLQSIRILKPPVATRMMWRRTRTLPSRPNCISKHTDRSHSNARSTDPQFKNKTQNIICIFGCLFCFGVCFIETPDLNRLPNCIVVKMTARTVGSLLILNMNNWMPWHFFIRKRTY